LTSSAPRRALLAAVVTITLLLAACGGGTAMTPLPSGAEPPADCARVDADGVITLSARDIQFSAPCMVANAGEAFTIHFTNEEAVPHDVAVYRDSSKGNEIMRGEIITGPDKSIDYRVEAQEAGEYYFNCTVHPAMDGALYVVEPSAG
jgi:plastocyanin